MLVRLPDLEHWKAQVKCQAGCPVSTDAGRYVQLVAEGRLEDAYLVARAPNPFASLTTRLVDTVTTPMLLKVVQSGRLQPKKLATHRFRLADVMKAYDTFGNAAKERPLKVILQNA